MKRIVCLLLALLLCLGALSACGEKPENPPASDPGSGAPSGGEVKEVPQGLNVTAVEDTLTVAQSGEPTVLDPQNQNDQPTAVVCWQMYENLVMRNNVSGEFEPLLAESWEQIDDRTIRFHIRKDIVDHAGNPFTANDVYFTVQRGCASTLKSYVWSAFDPDACKVVDEYTIDIATKEPFAPALQYLCNNGALMVSQKAVEDAGSLDAYGRNPTGATGPWKFVEWVAGDRIVLERNEDYYGEKPYFKYLVIRNITDDTTRSLSLESGDVDFVIKTATAQLETLRANPNVDIHSVTSTTLTYLCFNVGNGGPWADARVRQALRYALDMDSMVQLAFSGAAVTADSIYCNSLSCYVAPDAEHTYSYDVEKAKALLAEAGYEDGFEINLWTNENQSRVDLCDMIQNAWAQIGVTANVQILEFATELDMIHRGEHDAFIMGFVSAGDDGDFLHDNFYSSDNDYVQNTSGYKNARYDEIMDKARTSLDPAIRQECYAEVQELLNEDLPWLPIACATNDYGMRATLTGLDPDPQGILHFRWVQPK
ncbi:MAG: ABC transporter substrate-binding protein [Oscillospiraceae bacterium]|nr:ABC transporter substrate-binding protein [Oscillospiraceae bacterium]